VPERSVKYQKAVEGIRKGIFLGLYKPLIKNSFAEFEQQIGARYPPGSSENQKTVEVIRILKLKNIDQLYLLANEFSVYPVTKNKDTLIKHLSYLFASGIGNWNVAMARNWKDFCNKL